MSPGELKNADNTITFPAAGSAAGTATLVNGLANGTTAITRIGRRVTMKSVYIRGQVQLAATSTGATPIRLMVVYDRQPNGAAMTATDILLTDAIASPNNLSNSRRFQTIIDHVVPVIGTAGPQGYYYELYKKLDLATEYNNGSAGTVADISTGSLVAWVWTTNQIGVASLLSNVICRVRYADA